MKFSIKQSKVSIEKRLLTAMILSTDFLKQYTHIHRVGYFVTPYGDWVSQACIEYYQKFRTAPGKDILDVYRTALRSNSINPTLQDVSLAFLKGIEYDTGTINFQYLLDKARNYIVLRLHKMLRDRLDLALEKEDAALCEQAVTEVKGVQLQSGQICSPFTDRDKVREAFLKEETQLFKLKGAIGRMLNPQLKTKRFICFLGKAKSGKTWWLYFLAIVAKRFNNNVAVFAAGDEDEDSSIVRWACMLTGKNADEEYTGKFAVPVMDCVRNQKGDCFKKCRKCSGQLQEMSTEEFQKAKPEDLLNNTPKGYVPCTACRKKTDRAFEPAIWYKWRTIELLPWQQAFKVFKRFTRWTPKAEVKLFTYSSNSLTVSEINRQLDMEEDRSGWVPTVVIIDYPDIMKDESRTSEVRHQENSKWLNLRQLSQKRSVLLIVASQSNMGGYQSDSLGTSNVNEDRRKLDHVTAMYGINQTEAEKRKRIARLGPIVQRKGKFDTEYQILVLQALEAGLPVTDSQYVFKSMKVDKSS